MACGPSVVVWHVVATNITNALTPLTHYVRVTLTDVAALARKACVNGVEWLLSLCEDQVGFMTRMFDLDGMKTRIQALITFRAAHDKRLRAEAILPLYHLFLAGPTSRGEFLQMTGLGERTARGHCSRAFIETGLVTSTGHVAPVRFAFPLDALQFLLPELYPEAATQPD